MPGRLPAARSFREGKLGLFSTEEYTANPLPHVVENRVTVRRKLCDPATPRDYKIVSELIADGFTDYFVAADRSTPRAKPMR